MSPLREKLRALTIPVFVEIALVMLVGAVDTVMLGKYSDGAVAAVGLDNQLVSFCFLVYQFVSVGASILVAQYFGAGEKKRLSQVVALSVLLELAFGAAVSAFVWFRAERCLGVMGLRPELMADGVSYLRIVGVWSFFQAVSFALSASLRSTDRPNGPMVATAVINLLNVLGNYCLIFGHFGCPEMGAAGAAWASALARIVGFLILVGLHFRYRIWSLFVFLRERFPWGELRNLVRVGIPAMSEELSYCTSQIAITYFVNQISNEALAARTYAVNLIMFTYLFCSSITMGGSVVVGHLVGQKRYHPAYLVGNLVEHASMVITLAGSFILLCLGRPILGLITSNPEIIRLVSWVLVVDFFLEVGRVRNIFACGILRAAGDVIYPVVVGVTFQWSVAVGFSWFLGIPCGWGLIGMWIGFALDENLRGIILMRRWHRKGWVGKSFV